MVLLVLLSWNVSRWAVHRVALYYNQISQSSITSRRAYIFMEPQLEFKPRQRKVRKPLEDSDDERYVPPTEEWDPALPYGGKVYLARQQKPDPWWVTILEILLVIAITVLIYCSYYYLDHVIFHITNIHAHMGQAEARHRVAQRYLEGRGVQQDHGMAMHWLKKAAAQGHPEASYNLAVAHVRGATHLPTGEAHRLVQHAAAKGVKEAHEMLHEVCNKRGCD